MALQKDIDSETINNKQNATYVHDNKLLVGWLTPFNILCPALGNACKAYPISLRVKLPTKFFLEVRNSKNIKKQTGRNIQSHEAFINDIPIE